MGRTRDELDRYLPELIEIKKQQQDAYEEQYRHYVSLLRADDQQELFTGSSTRAHWLHRAIRVAMAEELRSGETEAKNRLFLALYGVDWQSHSQQQEELREAQQRESERQARVDRLISGHPLHPSVLDKMLLDGECTLQDEAVEELIEYYLENMDRQPAYKAWIEQHVKVKRMPPFEQDTDRQAQNIEVFKSVTSGSGGDPQQPPSSNGGIAVRFVGGSVGFSIRDATGTHVKVMKHQVYNVSPETWENLKEFSSRDWRLA